MFTNDFSEEIWSTTYKDHNDQTIEDTLARVARSLAAAEETKELQKLWEEKFYQYLHNFKITVGGRIYSNAGTEWGGTTFINCVSGDTLVHTKNGLVEAKFLSGEVETLSKDGVFRKAIWKTFCGYRTRLHTNREYNTFIVFYRK